MTLFGNNFTLSHQYNEQGSYTVVVSVTDNQNLTGTNSAIITVTNAPAVIGTIVAPVSPVQVNTAITATASFTDPGLLDTHTASWNWGDGNVTTGTVTENNGSGSVSDTHTYSAAGIYSIILSVADDENLSSVSPAFQYVVVYNPTGGFFTAGGKYHSLAGWYIQDPLSSGDVKFGVQAKYTTGNTPVGQSKVNFKVGNLDFNSTSNNWLVVVGNTAFLEGNGTINGAGNYNFLISGIDGSQTGGQSYVRVRITDSSNTVVYDTQPGAQEGADPTTPLTIGSVKVH